MTKPTPTEEQRQAAATIFDIVDSPHANHYHLDAIAALLAEREAPLWERAEKAEYDAAHNAGLAIAENRARAKAEANLATVQREHDALTKSTEAARAAIAKALGLTEWRALADLAADVTDLGDALTSARAEVARLREYRAAQERGEDYWTGIRDENTSLRAEVARLRALAASRAEVEALRTVLCEGEFLVGFAEHLARTLDPSLIAVDKLAAYAAKHRAALSSTPAPASASAEPATPTTEGGAK